VGSKYRLDAVDSGVEVAGTAGAFEGGPQLAMGELGSIRRGGRNGQNRACVGTSESTVGLMLERQQGGRVVPAGANAAGSRVADGSIPRPAPFVVVKNWRMSLLVGGP
jgi:hypothetical protein